MSSSEYSPTELSVSLTHGHLFWYHAHSVRIEFKVPEVLALCWGNRNVH